MAYDDAYYAEVFQGFERDSFARRWAHACALVGGYADQRWNSFLEVGAGLGQNLAIVDAPDKWAVDISERSRSSCTALGFQWRADIDEVPDRYFDAILLRHSLEHLPAPAEALKKLCAKARSEARLFVIVPVETAEIPDRFDEMDAHQHLYSWTPTTLRNLCLYAGWRPVRLQSHCGRGFHRMLPLAERYPSLFLRMRRFADRHLAGASGEIVACCVLAGSGRCIPAAA